MEINLKYLEPHIEKESITFSGPMGLPNGTVELLITFPTCENERDKENNSLIKITLMEQYIEMGGYKESIPQLINLLNVAYEWLSEKEK